MGRGWTDENEFAARLATPYDCGEFSGGSFMFVFFYLFFFFWVCVRVAAFTVLFVYFSAITRSLT